MFTLKWMYLMGILNGLGLIWPLLYVMALLIWKHKILDRFGPTT